MDETDLKDDGPATGMLPPMRLALFMVAGIALDFIIPLGLNSVWGRWWGWLGLIFVIGGLFLGKWAIQTFKKAGTNVPPNMPANAIVTSGPFQYSRNPMYLAMLIIYAGVAMMADAPLMLFLTIGFWYVLSRQVVSAEEAYMHKKFGDDYLNYQLRVRRWI